MLRSYEGKKKKVMDMGKIIQEIHEHEHAVNTFFLLFLWSIPLEEAVGFLHSHKQCELTQSSLEVANLGYRHGVI